MECLVYILFMSDIMWCKHDGVYEGYITGIIFVWLMLFNAYIRPYDYRLFKQNYIRFMMTTLVDSLYINFNYIVSWISLNEILLKII